jgi:hypothetical protein
MTNLVVISKPVVTTTNAAGYVHTQSMVVLGPTWMFAAAFLIVVVIAAFFIFGRR